MTFLPTADQQGYRWAGIRSVVTPGIVAGILSDVDTVAVLVLLAVAGLAGVVGGPPGQRVTPGRNAAPPDLSWQRCPDGATHRGRAGPRAGNLPHGSRDAGGPTVRT